MILRKLLSALFTTLTLGIMIIIILLLVFRNELQPGVGGVIFFYLAIYGIPILIFNGLYGVPCSVLIEVLVKKIKYKKSASLLLHIFFAFIFVPIFKYVYMKEVFSTDQLSVRNFVSGYEEFLVISLLSAILFWTYSIVIEKIYKKIISI